MVKVITLFKRKSGMSHEQCIEHWRSVHAQIAMADRSFWGRVRKYTQNYVVPVEGQSTAWDGVAELWFDSQEDVHAAFNGEETKRVLIPDLDNFVDQASMISVTTEENVISD
jgi:uncharacterized protein (TIGR02118 family)